MASIGDCSSAVAWLLFLQLIRQPIGPLSAVAWPLSLQLIPQLVVDAGECSSAVAWPLSLALTLWWPIDHVFAAVIVLFARQSEQCP